MTKFKFQELDEFNISENNIDDFVYTDDTIANILKSYLKFIYETSSIPELPSKIEIIYVEENKLFQKLGEIFNIKSYQKPENYVYPASMSPGTSTLYISTDFNEENKKISKIKKGIETNDIVLFRGYFNQDNQKALEYTFGHELGHFFLLSKNVNNPELDKDKFIRRISMNIEEGFAEAFSIQLMYLKDSNLDVNPIKNGRFLDSKLKFDEILENSDNEQRAKFFNIYGIEKLIDTYNFKTLYDNLPIKDSNGNIESNIDKIYEECLRISKENNKEVIQDILNNKTYKKEGLATVFKSDLMDRVKDINGILNNNDLIDKIHTKISGTSFNTTKMKMLREKFLDNKNDSTHKPK